jgi:hypothetical protein
MGLERDFAGIPEFWRIPLLADLRLTEQWAHSRNGDGKVNRLTADGKTWQPVSLLKQPRMVHRMVATNDGLLVLVGGASKGGNVALSEVIKP